MQPPYYVVFHPQRHTSGNYGSLWLTFSNTISNALWEIRYLRLRKYIYRRSREYSKNLNSRSITSLFFERFTRIVARSLADRQTTNNPFGEQFNNYSSQSIVHLATYLQGAIGFLDTLELRMGFK